MSYAYTAKAATEVPDELPEDWPFDWDFPFPPDEDPELVPDDDLTGDGIDDDEDGDTTDDDEMVPDFDIDAPWPPGWPIEPTDTYTIELTADDTVSDQDSDVLSIEGRVLELGADTSELEWHLVCVMAVLNNEIVGIKKESGDAYADAIYYQVENYSASKYGFQDDVYVDLENADSGETLKVFAAVISIAPWIEDMEQVGVVTHLAGTSAAVSTATGTLTCNVSLAGTSNGVSTATGTLSWTLTTIVELTSSSAIRKKYTYAGGGTWTGPVEDTTSIQAGIIGTDGVVGIGDVHSICRCYLGFEIPAGHVNATATLDFSFSSFSATEIRLFVTSDSSGVFEPSNQTELANYTTGGDKQIGLGVSAQGSEVYYLFFRALTGAEGGDEGDVFDDPFTTKRAALGSTPTLTVVSSQ